MVVIAASTLWEVWLRSQEAQRRGSQNKIRPWRNGRIEAKGAKVEDLNGGGTLEETPVKTPYVQQQKRNV
jgi:hypothetical protein